MLDMELLIRRVGNRMYESGVGLDDVTMGTVLLNAADLSYAVWEWLPKQRQEALEGVRQYYVERDKEAEVIALRDAGGVTGYRVVYRGSILSPWFNSHGAADAYRVGVLRGTRKPEY